MSGAPSGRGRGAVSCAQRVGEVAVGDGGIEARGGMLLGSRCWEGVEGDVAGFCLTFGAGPSFWYFCPSAIELALECASGVCSSPLFSCLCLGGALVFSIWHRTGLTAGSRTSLYMFLVVCMLLCIARSIACYARSY